MRFNNRFCALMDIPDLPAGAFEHIGDKKIKPQGGGGGVVGAITNPISKAIGTDGSGGGVLGGLAKIDPGPAIGSGLAEVDKFVGREIPGGWTTVGVGTLAGTGLYFAPELAAAFGGEGLTTALPYTEVFDAANLASQGLGAADIASNLTISAGLDPFIAADLGSLAAQGLGPEQLARTLAFSYTDAELAPLGIKSMIGAKDAGLSAKDVYQGTRLAKSLLGAGQNPLQQQSLQARGISGQAKPAGMVDYSGILNLLETPMAQRNPNSLLG